MFFKIIIMIFFSLFLISCTTNKQLPKQCYKKGFSGKCKGYFKRYQYNLEKEQCEQYIFGGCGEVVFKTLKECEETCK